MQAEKSRLTSARPNYSSLCHKTINKAEKPTVFIEEGGLLIRGLVKGRHTIPSTLYTHTTDDLYQKTTQ